MYVMRSKSLRAYLSTSVEILKDDSDAENLRWVYRWRAQQEIDLRARTGNAMSEIEVIQFVDGCECSIPLVQSGTELVENAEGQRQTRLSSL